MPGKGWEQTTSEPWFAETLAIADHPCRKLTAVETRPAATQLGQSKRQRLPAAAGVDPTAAAAAAGKPLSESAELSVDLPHAGDSAELGLKQVRPRVRRSHVESKDGCTHERAGHPVYDHTVLRAQIVSSIGFASLRRSLTRHHIRHDEGELSGREVSSCC